MLTVPLSTKVYKWVPANLMLGSTPCHFMLTETEISPSLMSHLGHMQSLSLHPYLRYRNSYVVCTVIVK